MRVGQLARRALGPTFPVAGAAYRRVFVDIRNVANALPELPPGSTLLDVGIGDGAITNAILDRQPDLEVIGIDTAPEIGGMLRPDLRDHVELHPATSVAELAASRTLAISAAFLSDVLHHVPGDARAGLIADVLSAFGGAPRQLIVKEIIPQGPRSRAAFWVDRNISGDRGAKAIGPTELVSLVRSVWPTAQVQTTDLQQVDYPNYCLIFREA